MTPMPPAPTTRLPLIMPQLGESIAEARVIRWRVAEGDEVAADQEVMEVETNKATLAVTSPCSGRLVQRIADPDRSYPVGAVLGYIEVHREDAQGLGGADEMRPPSSLAPAPAESGPPSLLTAPPDVKRVEPTVRGLPVPAQVGGASYMSPRMKARMAELGLHAADLAGVAGSGAGGRVTIDDFEKFLNRLEQKRLSPASAMRVAVADAMRRSWTRPLATVGLPVCLDAVLRHRKTCDPKPGPTLYALRALALALAENSAPAGRLVGNRIVHPSTIDIGFAVEAEDGVLVPVIRDVDHRSLGELNRLYNQLVAMARLRQLPVDATGGSIATVTNYGTFGLTWATPIPLPEQTLVLGLGAGRPAPRWDAGAGQFVSVIEAEITLSFDHRVLDGGAAGRLLTRIAELLNQPDRL